jgi:hypothetical protein
VATQEVIRGGGVATIVRATVRAAPGAAQRPQRFPQRIGFVWRVYHDICGRTECLTAQTGGFRRGQRGADIMAACGQLHSTQQQLAVA